MDLKQIKALIAFLDGTRFTEVEIEQEGVRLRLSQDTAPVVAPVPAPQAVTVAPATAHAQPTAPAVESGTGGFDVRIPEEDNGKVVASPIVGTFYTAPSPDKSAYVKVGDAVRKGQVVCIVEAMKLMNEIESEFSGKVTAILAEDGEPVEFGQPLIRIEA